MQKVIFQDWGLMDYDKAWKAQQALHQEKIDLKRQNWKRKEEGLDLLPQQHHLIFCSHPHVYTLGKSGSLSNLLLSEKELESKNATFYKINRGGDITYHGPGQVVAYPIFDLEYFFTDVHRYVRSLEEVVIRTLADYGIEGGREKGYTGVWLAATETLPKRKICAIGVHLSRWITMHGFAFNVQTDLNYFKNIIPCGIQEADKDVTSLEKELGKKIEMTKVKNRLKFHFKEIFEFEFYDERYPHQEGKRFGNRNRTTPKL